MTDQWGYFINQELLEMVRLNRQANLVTREMGGAVSEPLHVAAFQDVLDLACGEYEAKRLFNLHRCLFQQRLDNAVMMEGVRIFYEDLPGGWNL